MRGRRRVARHPGNVRPASRRADFKHLAVIAGLGRDSELPAAVKPRHDRHHAHDRPVPRAVERGLHTFLLAELDQVARGRKRQFETPALAACQGLARRHPDRIGVFLAVVGAGLLWRCRGKKEPGVEPLWHALRRDPVRVGHKFIECQQQSVVGENFQKGQLALAQRGAIGSFDLAGALRVDQGVRPAPPRQQDAALLKGFADRGDPETYSPGIKPLAAGIKLRSGDDLLVALVDAAAGKHQRARVKVDLIMAYHHEDLDLIRGCAVARQQGGGRGTGGDGFGGHELSLLPSSWGAASGRVSKDENVLASWFETREDALLTMRILAIPPRWIAAAGSRGYRPAPPATANSLLRPLPWR